MDSRRRSRAARTIRGIRCTLFSSLSGCSSGTSWRFGAIVSTFFKSWRSKEHDGSTCVLFLGSPSFLRLLPLLFVVASSVSLCRLGPLWSCCFGFLIVAFFPIDGIPVSYCYRTLWLVRCGRIWIASLDSIFLLLSFRHSQRPPHRRFDLEECDTVLRASVTTYFSSAAYPIDSMRTSAGATWAANRLVYGDEML